MAKQWIYARDVVEIDATFEATVDAEIAAGHLAPGDTIVILSLIHI